MKNAVNLCKMHYTWKELHLRISSIITVYTCSKRQLTSSIVKERRVFLNLMLFLVCSAAMLIIGCGCQAVTFYIRKQEVANSTSQPLKAAMSNISQKNKWPSPFVKTLHS
jgi:hypothetical protein